MIWVQPENVNGSPVKPTLTGSCLASGNGEKARRVAIEVDDRLLRRREEGETLELDRYSEEIPGVLMEEWSDSEAIVEVVMVVR